MSLRFEKGDVIEAMPQPGRPNGNGIIRELKYLGTSVVYLVEYPDGRIHKYFAWQITKVEPEELMQTG